MKLLKKFIAHLSRLLRQKPNTDLNKKKDRPDSQTTSPIIEDLAPTPFQILKSQTGVAEKTHPDLIRKYHRAAGLNAGPETSWCSSVLIWCFKQANYKLPESVNAWAPTWKNAGKNIELKDAKEGDVVGVIGLGGSGIHVGMFVKHVDDNRFILLAGNDGNLVRETSRHKYEVEFIRRYY